MQYISYILKTNTNFVNKNNLFNFFIAILQHRNEEEDKLIEINEIFKTIEENTRDKIFFYFEKLY